MRVIRPYGSSVVKENTDKRQIKPLDKFKNGDELRPIADFIKNTDKAVIAQWISIIDKIIAKPGEITKPKGNDKEMQCAQRLRKMLGDAAWRKIEEKKLLPKLTKIEDKEKIKKLWDWKIAATQPKQPDDKKGRWYKVFVGDSECNEKNIEENARQIVDRIYKHLYEKAYRFPPKTDGSKVQNGGSSEPRCFDKGLIEHRANSIENNVLKSTEKKVVLCNETDKENYVKKAGEFACKIRKAILKEWQKEENQSNNRSTNNSEQRNTSNQSTKFQQNSRNNGNGYKDRPYHIAVKELRAIWKQIFGGFKTIRAVKVTKNKSLLNLHLQIKETYKSLLKDRKKLNQKLETILPANNDALFALLEAQQKNQKVNHLIRLGKVIHYQASLLTTSDAEYRDNTAFIVKHWPIKEGIEESYFWSSKGQTEIKQNEAFVRIWRSALAFAARTLKDWADPENEIPGDILIERKEALCKFNTQYFDKKFETLFGKREEELSVDEGLKKDLLQFSLQTVFDLRNYAFHFKGMGNFIKTLKKKNSSCSDFLEKTYKSDYQKNQEKQKRIMEGAHFHDFFARTEIEKFWCKTTTAESSLLLLPKLKRVLERVEDAWKGKILLPPYSTADEREASKWARCQYIATKLLYDKPFKNWLEKLGEKDQNPATINGYINQAIDHTTEAARAINGKNKDAKYIDFIEAKVSNFGGLKTGEELKDFFSRLTAAATAEMRIQSAYQSNGEEAKKQAGYIEKFKCDVVALAFADYLKEIITDIKIFCQKERTETFEKAFDYENLHLKQVKECESWQTQLYFILHLIPVEDVGILRQQLKKWDAVTEKSHGEELREKKLLKSHDKVSREQELLKSLEIFDLYIDMHDAQFAGAELDSLSEDDKKTVKDFFETDKDFEKVFLNKTDSSENACPPPLLRGLREMQRFGQGVLHEIFQKHKITHKAVEDWQISKKTIDEKQQELKKLHEEWAKGKDKKEFIKQNSCKYKAALKAVENHRHLTAQVMLQDHVHLHRLLMKILGRLVDFSGLWERDLYFVLLALLYENNIANIKEQFDGKNDKIQNDKHGIDFLKNGQIVEAFIKLKNDKIKSKITSLLNIKGVNLHCKNKDLKDPSYEEKNKLLEKQDEQLKEKDYLVWIRNRFAHLAMLEEQNLPINLTKEINKARYLMAYDRKLKNAVSKSIISLLKRENIILKWNMGDDHNLEKISFFKSDEASHLGGKEIKEKLCSSHFIDMAKFLFEEKNQKKSCEKAV